MKLTQILAAAALAIASVAPAYAHGDAAERETITPAFVEAMPNVPGKTMTALVVDYAPGGKSDPHRHGQAFVVAMCSRARSAARSTTARTRVFHAGEHWIEKPGAHHTVSENASDTEPAKLLAIFVADAKDKKLVTFDKK